MLERMAPGGPEEPATPRNEECANPRLSVLVVEDDVDAGATLGELLALFGHQVRVERSGEAGLEAAAAELPEVLICDVGLPDLSGLEVIRRLRGHASTAPVFAVALTGYARAQDREEALRAGFDAHLAKPQDLAELQRVLALGRARRVAPGC